MEKSGTNLSIIIKFFGFLSIACGLLITANLVDKIGTSMGLYASYVWLISGLVSGIIFFAIAEIIELLNSINEKLKYNYKPENIENDKTINNNINDLDEDDIFPENDGFAAEKNDNKK